MGSIFPKWRKVKEWEKEREGGINRLIMKLFLYFEESKVEQGSIGVH